jgi:ArsR family transcriptional regulator, lead/cadmium/zinc/bismuth-responsive transcriptional repressor
MQISTSTVVTESATVEALAETFRILGDPTRIRIVEALAQGELCVHELSDRVGISESAVSHQLRLMRTMRIVRGRRAGRCVYYTLDDQHVLDLFQQGLRHVTEVRK